MLSELGLTRIRSALLDSSVGTEEHKEGPPFLSVEALSKVRYLDHERLERTIWVSPLNAYHSAAKVKKFFEEKKCGIVVEVRIREGAKVQGKPSGNRYAFVEFAHPTSVLRALRLASKKKS